MGEQERENQPVIHKNSKQNKSRKYFPPAAKILRGLVIAAKIIGGIAVVMGIISSFIEVHTKFFSEPTNADIECSLVKHEKGGVIIYYGQLSNKSSYHAKDFVIRGQFNTNILDYGIVEGKDFEKKGDCQDGAFEFYSKRFLGNHNCIFFIMVDHNTKIIEQISASWGDKGQSVLTPKASDKNIDTWFTLWGKASALSRPARQKRFESDAKHIR